MHLEDEVPAACALAHSEAHPSREMHRLRALCPAIQDMATGLGAHAVRVTVPHPVRSGRLRTAYRMPCCCQPLQPQLCTVSQQKFDAAVLRRQQGESVLCIGA